jgi:hypothetical protein
MAAIQNEEGLVRRLVTLLETGMYNDNGAAVCGTLRNMAGTDDSYFRNQIVEHGGVEALLERVPNVSEALGALANVTSASPDHRRAVYDAGGVSIILAAMRAQPLDSQVQVLGCQALNRGVLVCQPTAKLDALDQGCLAVMESVMSTFAQSVPVQKEACLCLYHVLHGPHMRNAVVEMNKPRIIALVTAAGQLDPTDALLQQVVPLVLFNTVLAPSEDDMIRQILGPNVLWTGSYR